MKRSRNKIRQWHKIGWFHALYQCSQAVFTYSGISVKIWVEIMIKMPEKHGFRPIILQYPLRYFSQIVEKTCGIFLRLHSGKKSLRSTFLPDVPHRTSTDFRKKLRNFFQIWIDTNNEFSNIWLLKSWVFTRWTEMNIIYLKLKAQTSLPSLSINF